MHLRSELGCGPSDLLVVSVGELSRRKNYELVIKAVAQSQNKNIVYCIAGTGPLKDI